MKKFTDIKSSWLQVNYTEVVVLSALSAVAGIITSLAVKQTIPGWLALFTLVIPIVFIFRIESIKFTAIVGLSFGLAYFLQLNSWFLKLVPYAGAWITVGWILSSFYLAMFTIGAFLAIKVIHRKFKNQVLAWLVASVAWIAVELLMTLGPLGFHWGLAGYSLTGTPVIKGAQFYGWAGLSFIVIAVNVLIVQILLARNKKDAMYLALAGATLAIIILIAVFASSTVYLPDVSVAALRTDIASTEKFYGQDSFIENIILMNETERISKAHGLIIWPESVFPDFDGSVKEKTAPIDNLIFGTLRTAREKRFNSVVSNYEGQKIIYDKNEPVLFGEYIPFDFISKAIPVLQNSITKGNKPGIFSTPYGKAGAVVCSESASPHLIRNKVLKGAGLILIPTNDEWFKGTIFAEHHFLIARLRAAETGRYVVQSANGGRTAIIDNQGNVVKSKSKGTGFIASRVKFLKGKTFYVRHGWMFPYIALIYLILFLIYTSSIYLYERLRG